PIMELDDVRIHSSRHPTVAFNAEGELRVIWIDGGAEYARDGVVRVRARAPGGSWSASVAIPDQAMTAIDNGPSLLVPPGSVYHRSFCNYGNEIRYWYDAGGGWRGDQQPPATVTHNPSLGPDAAGGVYIYGHGTPPLAIQGHGNDLFYFHKGAGGTSWSAWTK